MVNEGTAVRMLTDVRALCVNLSGQAGVQRNEARNLHKYIFQRERAQAQARVRTLKIDPLIIYATSAARRVIYEHAVSLKPPTE